MAACTALGSTAGPTETFTEGLGKTTAGAGVGGTSGLSSV